MLGFLISNSRIRDFLLATSRIPLFDLVLFFSMHSAGNQQLFDIMRDWRWQAEKFGQYKSFVIYGLVDEIKFMPFSAKLAWRLQVLQQVCNECPHITERRRS